MNIREKKIEEIWHIVRDAPFSVFHDEVQRREAVKEFSDELGITGKDGLLDVLEEAVDFIEERVGADDKYVELVNKIYTHLSQWREE